MKIQFSADAFVPVLHSVSSALEKCMRVYASPAFLHRYNKIT